jgi:hypothetical protein
MTRRDGGGRRQGTRGVGGRRKAREWRVMKATRWRRQHIAMSQDRIREKQVLSKFSGALKKIDQGNSRSQTPLSYKSKTASQTTVLVDLHKTRLARSALNH